jgi:hypothetical protein
MFSSSGGSDYTAAAVAASSSSRTCSLMIGPSTSQASMALHCMVWFGTTSSETRGWMGAETLRSRQHLLGHCMFPRLSQTCLVLNYVHSDVHGLFTALLTAMFTYRCIC